MRHQETLPHLYSKENLNLIIHFTCFLTPKMQKFMCPAAQPASISPYNAVELASHLSESQYTC